MCNFYTVLLQIHSGNCLQKIGILDLCLIKLFQTNKGTIFCLTVYKHGVSELTLRDSNFQSIDALALCWAS